MKVISLFAGIEGFGLAAHRMGWDVVASVEWETFPRMVIKRRFPKTELYGDIRTFSGERYRGAIDIVCGGFPCQPFSVAGLQKGVDDHRYLWPEMLRTIREVQPTWVVGENVAGIINMGIPTDEFRMEGEEFTVKEEVLVLQQIWQDLEDIGYQVQPFVIPAVAVNAPHRRDRIWIVAHSEGQRSKRYGFKQSKVSTEEQRQFGGRNSEMADGITPDTTRHDGGKVFPEFKNPIDQGEYFINGKKGGIEQVNDSHANKFRHKRHQRLRQDYAEGRKWRERLHGTTPKLHNGDYWSKWPSQSPICDGDDGISSELVRYILRRGGDVYSKETAQKEANRIISFVRRNAIKAGGNAIVHQIALELFKAIESYESSRDKIGL